MNIRPLGLGQLEELAEDLRQVIIEVTLKNGGHLGASLGAVEIAIALHHTFESPTDPILWDVGHQAYAHKLLTGRRDRFDSLRKLGGISGFLSRQESPHDVFGAGHSSTAISAALGIAWAKNQDPLNHDWTIAVVGDGGLSAGLSFEALNQISGLGLKRTLIVLNDNQMSISPNVGGVASLIAQGQTKNFFEPFGIQYTGPIDGHDLRSMLRSLQEIRASESDRPVLIHFVTQKGRGYLPAEERPDLFHGVSPMTTQKISTPPNQGESFSSVFGRTMIELASADPKVVALTAAMPEGTGLSEFAAKLPGQFFDTGIAEFHTVTFAAGLATQGYKPVVAIYSTFLQRAIDGIIHDVALQKLPVVLAIDRAGLVGADGPTHHGVFDIAYLSMIPNLAIFAPGCLEDLPFILKECLALSGPSAIRYPRGSAVKSLAEPIQEGVRWHQVATRPKSVAVATGTRAELVSALCKKLDPNQEFLTCVSVVRLKPIPKTLIQYLGDHPGAKIFVIEDGCLTGGFGQTLVAEKQKSVAAATVLGVQDHFVAHGSIAELEKSEGLTAPQIEDALRSLMGL